MTYIPQDYYFKKAKKENYNARSIYKLQEINDRFSLIKPGQKILELGTGHGSWLQYYSPIIGKKGSALTIDKLAIDSHILDKKSYHNVIFVNADILDCDIIDIVYDNGFSKFDMILSDLSPETTGIKEKDTLISFELCKKAYNIGDLFLKDDGTMVCKMFDSEYTSQFENKLKKSFLSTEKTRPKSVRHNSSELFFVSKHYKSEEF